LWKRVLVFLSAIPITIAMNSLRIAFVGLSLNWWGNQMADDVLHFFEGWIIFLACAALLLLVIYLLSRVSSTGSFYDAFYVPTFKIKNPRPPRFATLRNSVPMLASLLALLAIGGMTYQISHRKEIIPERPRFASFPAKVGAWQGATSDLNPEVERYLKVDDYLLSDYVGADGKPINLYVAYYGSQRKGSSPHSPRVCIPGGGWQITELQRASYANATANVTLPYNRAIIEKGTSKQLVYYWFSQRGRNIANEYVSKWYLLADAVLRNRTDGALIRLTTPVGNDESAHDADERLQAFLVNVESELRRFLPPLGKHE
jgi:exosortase D (VPLPA-CTERM-specific)